MTAMQPVTRPGAGTTAARAIMTGTIGNGATWYEDIDMTEDGASIPNADTWEWHLTIRPDYSSTVTMTLTTVDGTLTITQSAPATTLGIRVAYSDLSALEGDYIGDLASQDAAGRVIHWAHGTITFRDEPIWS